MRSKIPYFPGCSLRTSATHFEQTAIASAATLGLDLVELTDWTCCGTVQALATDAKMQHIGTVRSLKRVEEMNNNGLLKKENRLITFCSMCYHTLKTVNQTVLADKDKLDTINEFMDQEQHKYQGTANVVHYFEVLKELGFSKIKSKVKNPLTGLKLAPYYGCLLLRPQGIGIDDMDNPQVMEQLLKTLGAEVVDYAAKSKCCGSYHTTGNPEFTVALAQEILTRAKGAGANALVLSCPLCGFNLDSMQQKILEIQSDWETIPIFYFPQLMTLSFGLNPDLCQFETHAIDPNPLLSSLFPPSIRKEKSRKKVKT
ncbi:MAG: CoB--CoM heterodisulfide reductase iron-sulfur subunit B family protein [Candidatus Ranarchaeia archaeon]